MGEKSPTGGAMGSPQGKISSTASASALQQLQMQQQQLIAQVQLVQQRMLMVRPYRITHLLGKNFPLTWFRHLWQLVGRYCSCVLPRQDGGTSQI